MTLVLTYAPHDDEDGFGYYRRLTADNALSDWRNLTDVAGVDRNRRALFKRTDGVAENLGLEPMWADSANQKEECCRSWGLLYRSQSDAVCPECLAESPYLRHSWGHVYVTACPHHHLLLVDTCNACGQKLSPERNHIGICSCGHDLTCLPRLAASRPQQWLSTLIANNGQASWGMAPTLRGVDITVLVKVVQTLCLHPDPARPKLPRAMALPKSIADANLFLAPLEVLLADWPKGFRTHVEQRIVAGRKNSRTLNTLLGDWYISLRKIAMGTALEPFVHIVINVAAEKSDCVLGLDSAKEIAEDATGYVRSFDAAKALGISRSRLHDSILSNECAHRAKRAGTRGLVYEVPCVEIERIRQQRAKWISDATACSLAGVSQAVLDRMKAAGVINSDIRWREDLMKGGTVDQQSILDLHRRLEEWTPSTPADEGTTLEFAELTSRRMGEKRAIEALMKAISNGEVKAVKHAKTLGEFAFRMSDVQQYFGTPLLESGMSLQQLAKAANWKWESISHWVTEGLLGSELIQRRGQPCRIVMPHQLLTFRQSYIPLADLARAMGTKASALSRLLHRVKLVGAKQLPDGAMRGGLIRIDDLGRLALLGARAGEDLFVPSE